MNMPANYQMHLSVCINQEHRYCVGNSCSTMLLSFWHHLVNILTSWGWAVPSSVLAVDSSARYRAVLLELRLKENKIWYIEPPFKMLFLHKLLLFQQDRHKCVLKGCTFKITVIMKSWEITFCLLTSFNWQVGETDILFLIKHLSTLPPPAWSLGWISSKYRALSRW